MDGRKKYDGMKIKIFGFHCSLKNMSKAMMDVRGDYLTVHLDLKKVPLAKKGRELNLSTIK